MAIQNEVIMSSDVDFEQQCRDKMTVMFLSEIMNRLGVVEAGKILSNVMTSVEKEEDEYTRLKLNNFVNDVKEHYMKN